MELSGSDISPETALEPFQQEDVSSFPVNPDKNPLLLQKSWVCSIIIYVIL